MKKENKRPCGISIETLNAYIDNELSAKERLSVEEHIKSCYFCQKAIEEIKGVDELIQKMDIEEPSGEFLYGLKNKVMERIERRKNLIFKRFLPILAPIGVGIILIIIIKSEGLENPVGMKERINYNLFEERKVTEVIPSYEGVGPEASLKTESAQRLRGPKIQVSSETGLSIISEEGVSEKGSEVVIRAIVDSTGRIISVARGSSIIPEQDTILNRRLKGRKVPISKVQNQPARIFVEFKPGELDLN
uniref:Zf-HC2 domain-containing protein n=1 Tax=candidate division WOR-3 bacterium TaxID=2052148 RepID=A0A7V3RG56_UNCW3